MLVNVIQHQRQLCVGWWWERREAAGKLFPKLEKYREKGDRVRSRHTKLLLHKPRKTGVGVQSCSWFILLIPLVDISYDIL